MSRNVDFYELDKTKPIGIEGTPKKINFFIIFSGVFVGIFLIAVACTYKTINNLESILAVSLIAFIGLVFWGFSIWTLYRNNKKRAKYKEIISNCILTDGIIKNYVCRKVAHTSSRDTTYFYEVSMEYSFYDTNLKQRIDSFKHTYNSEPQFYKGQYLMVAFNENGSLILNKFSLKTEDEHRFAEIELARSADDFDSITGKLININMTKPIKSAEFVRNYFIAAACLSGLFIPIIVSISIIIFKMVIPSNPVVVAITASVIFAVCVIFLLLICFILRIGLRKRKEFINIINNNPSFTFGKLFTSEKTYRKRSKKQIFYCYIDSEGNRHKETTNSPVLLRCIEDQRPDVLVAYDKAGKSITLFGYTVNL